MKDYDKNKKSLYLKYGDVNNLHGWAMSKKLPLNGFKWVKNTSQFSQDFIENYNENSNEGYAFGFHAEYTEIAKVGNIAKFV